MNAHLSVAMVSSAQGAWCTLPTLPPSAAATREPHRFSMVVVCVVLSSPLGKSLKADCAADAAPLSAASPAAVGQGERERAALPV